MRSLNGHVDGVHALAFAPDGKSLAAGLGNTSISPGDVLIWDLEDGQPRQVLEGHGDRLWAVAYSPDGSLLASGGTDRAARVWDLHAGRPRPLDTKSDVWMLALSPDGKTLAVGDGDGLVTLWEMASGRQLRALGGKGTGVRDLQFGADDTLLALGSDKMLRVWDAGTGELKSSVELKNLEDVAFGLVARFSPDGRTLAATPGRGPIRLYDVTTGEQTSSFEPKEVVSSLAWSPDGRSLAVGCERWEETEIQVWDVPLFLAFVPRLRLKGHVRKDQFATVMSLAFSPDGQVLASGDGEATIFLWDTFSGLKRQTLHTQRKGVLGLAFSQDGKMLATAAGNLVGYPGEVRLWDVATGQERGDLGRQTSMVFRVLFGRGDQALITTTDDKRVWLWDLSRP